MRPVQPTTYTLVQAARFVAAALVLFVAWLTALGVLTAMSAKKPPANDRTPAAAAR